MTVRAVAEISAAAVRHNLARTREAAPGSRITAVIKSDGYGHGIVRVAQALEAADGYAVARCHEAMTLREAGISKPILVLEGFLDAGELEQCAGYGLEAALQHDSQLEMLRQAHVVGSVRVWIKLDTGMHRLGFLPERFSEVLASLRALSLVSDDVAVMSHLANADDPDDPLTVTQCRRFLAATNGFDGERALANSAGVLGWPQTHLDRVRPGIMLYGCTPFLEGAAVEAGLRPAMTLRTKVIALTEIEPGEAVGYGGTWRAARKTRIGVVAAGYGDGYPRHAPSGTPTLINGHIAPIIGRVSMDMITIDLTEHPGANVGDGVVLWGDGLPIEIVAERAGTISYELLCGVTQRVLRVDRGES